MVARMAYHGSDSCKCGVKDPGVVEIHVSNAQTVM